MAPTTDSITPQHDIAVLVAARDEIPIVRQMLFSIIDEIEIYNEPAKDYERELYTLDYMNSLMDDDSSSILVAKQDTVVCGFLITKPDNGPIWLCWFGVGPSVRGKGIGSLLIGKLIELAQGRGIHKIWCDTRTSNAYSIPILTSYGFERMCRLNNHWCHQDYYLWQKYIGDVDRGREADRDAS